MAEFTPRTSEEILRDAIDYLYHNTNLSDFNVGSAIRTILEVMANEDAEQYFQMFNILEAFFLRNATGAALDDRAAQYDMTRIPPSFSTGEIIFLDTQLKRSFLINEVAAGDPDIFVQNTSVFPGIPFIVQLGEGSGSQEQVQISAVNATTGALTIDVGATAPFDALSYAHSAAMTGVAEIDNRYSLVCFVNGAATDKLIASGVTLRAEPTNVSLNVECLTTEVGIQRVGYFASDSIKVKSTSLGVESNIPEGRLNDISGGPPYNGAGVINLDAISGGRESETDPEFRERIRNHIAGLSSGTIKAIVDSLLQVADPTTGQIITRARLVEDFDKETVFAYVDDASTNFVVDEERFAEDSLDGPALLGANFLLLNSLSGFTVSTFSNKSTIVIDPLGANPFVTQYTELVTATNTLDSIAPVLTSAYATNDIVSLCEPVSFNTEANRKYFQLDKFPLGDDALRLFRTAPDPVTGISKGVATLLIQLLPGASKTYDGATGALIEDYIVNESNGQIEFFDEKIAVAGSGLFAIYEIYTNVIKVAQTVVDGDMNNLAAIPGSRSAGVKVLVRPASRSPINVTVDTTVDTSISDPNTVILLAKQLIITYVNNLDIGESVIRAEIIDRVMGIPGVTNCKVITPSTDIDINHDSVAYANNIIVI